MEFALGPFTLVPALDRAVRPFCVDHLTLSLPYAFLEFTLVEASVAILLLALAIVLVFCPVTIVVALNLLARLYATDHLALSASLAICKVTRVGSAVSEHQLSCAIHIAILPKPVVSYILCNSEASLIGLAILQLTLVEALVSIDNNSLPLWPAFLVNFSGVSGTVLEKFVLHKLTQRVDSRMSFFDNKLLEELFCALL